MTPDQIIDGFLLAAAAFSIGLGYVMFTPADFAHFEVDGGEMRWTEQ
ncbi:hypothetical protein [Williamsia sp.]